LIIRMKKADQSEGLVPTHDKPEVIEKLVQYINSYYREKHSPTDYADLLNVPAATLGSLVKKYFDKTLTTLISDRIMVEAKRELYLTSKSVKEISFLLGYKDEYYFSRFFKRHAGISPSIYRKTVGFAKLEQ
ncbi:MAG: helix-turn-helix domain-containing protein, partial [Bacteroidota bacterium]